MSSIIIPDRRNLLCLDTSVYVVFSEMVFFSWETGRYLKSPLINSIIGVEMKTTKQDNVEC